MNNQRGFTLTEILISFALLMVGLVAAASVLVTGAKVNQAQQLTVDVQSTARNTLSVIVQALRSGGWNPRNVNTIDKAVMLDQNLGDRISEITVYADLSADGDLNDDGETLKISHDPVHNRVEWVRFPDTETDLDKKKPRPIGVHITNDEDGDGTPEPMFAADNTTDPTRITVKITAESPVRDLATGRYIRYTVKSDVLLRRNEWN
jgi:type II secretory pathway pseudopilin PulG